MRTATVCIGNSDNKLTQADWARFIEMTDDLIHISSPQIYFSGFSDPKAVWQNACWVFVLMSPEDERFRRRLARVASNFHQDSIALVVGETELIEAAE